jgi:peptidoglycan hydrolase-like protein with peptidoglycan-binding domain
MTIYGEDLASYQAGQQLGAVLDASWFEIKATEGASYVDPYYAGWVSQATSIGKPYLWYHFLTAGDPVAAQIANIVAHVDLSIPGLLDVETESGTTPSLPMVMATVTGVLAAGGRIKFAYIPQWMWQGVWGSPSLLPLQALGVYLISSQYPSNTVGTGPSQYAADGGDGGAGWASYGGVSPQLWQFTDSAAEGGQNVDFNAYRGTLAQFEALLGESAVELSADTVSAAIEHPTVQLGSTGEEVAALQTLLTHLGFNPQGIDGAFGGNTRTAVENAQKAWKISDDGIVGPQTQGSLTAALKTLAYGGTLVKSGSSGPQVQLVQALCWWRGYDPQGIDGDDGPDTSAAILAFQTAAGISRDSEAGPVTFDALIGATPA